MLDGDVADELHQGDGLAHAGTAEQAHLAALGDGHHQVDDLDAGFQDLNRGGLVGVGRGLAVDGPLDLGAHRAGLVHRVAQHIHDPAQGGLADGHGDGRAGVLDHRTTAQAVGGAHGDGAHDAVAQLLLHLESEVGVVHLHRVEDLGQGGTGKLHVHHRANDLNDFSFGHFSVSCKFEFLWAPPVVIPRTRRRRFRSIPG